MNSQTNLTMKTLMAMLFIFGVLAPPAICNELPAAVPVEGWSLLLNEALRRSNGDNEKLPAALQEVANETDAAALKTANLPNYKKMAGVITAGLLSWYGLELQKASSTPYNKQQWRQRRVQYLQLIETSRQKAGQEAVNQSWQNLLRAARILDLPQVEFIE
jgi:hypothetical protein